MYKNYNKYGDTQFTRTNLEEPEEMESAPMDTRNCEPTPLPIPIEIYVEVVNCRKLNLRELPDKTGKVLAVLSIGDVLKLDTIFPSDIDGWMRVHTTDTNPIYGYVKAEFVKY
jgi:hypothetical protein